MKEPKPKSKLEILFGDLEYALFGIDVHVFLFRIFPPREGAMVLEPGCGCGKFGLAYAVRGCEVIMIDIDPEQIRSARKIRDAMNALIGFSAATRITLGNIHKMHFSDNSFDFVFNEGVPQHWTEEEQRQGSINEMVRVLKLGGVCCVIGNNGLITKEQETDENFEFHYVGMPSHRKCFTPDELETRLKKAGLKSVQVEPITKTSIEKSALIAGWGLKQ